MLLYRTRIQFFLLPCAFCRNTFFPAFLSLLL
nr:MAG TPA: restriction alleviation protein [Caudoviricetes sp.]